MTHTVWREKPLYFSPRNHCRWPPLAAHACAAHACVAHAVWFPASGTIKKYSPLAVYACVAHAWTAHAHTLKAARFELLEADPEHSPILRKALYLLLEKLCAAALCITKPLAPSQKGSRMSQKKDPKDTCVLVTGGAGFIGSHTVVELLNCGYEAIIVDDLSNASEKVVDRIKTIVGKKNAARLTFYKADVNNRSELNRIFDSHHVDRVIHFAGFKAVGESVTKPIEYYSNNLGSTLTLLDVMRAHDCKSIIFSSSATVYGDPDALPLTEESPKKPATNPYGWTKWMIEQILTDVHTADPTWNVVLLRYFNPIGAHQSGLIGEDPTGIPNNLVPYVAQTAIGKREAVHVFGNDYNTPDGTGVRDYIHVCDLGTGHVAALTWMNGREGVEIFNLGTGVGSSVLDIIKAFSRACGKDIPYVIDPRRAGDVDANYADCSKAAKELGWTAQYNLDDMCRDSWKWQSMNPNGYRG